LSSVGSRSETFRNKIVSQSSPTRVIDGSASFVIYKPKTASDPDAAVRARHHSSRGGAANGAERAQLATRNADHLVRCTTTASVAKLAVIAAVVSYGHMHALVLSHGEGAWTSALIPLSVDGMIVASSMALLLDSRLVNRGGILPWTLLITGALASLGANIAVAEPTIIGRVIAAWPSFALTASYELLMRQIRQSAATRAATATRPVGRVSGRRMNRWLNPRYRGYHTTWYPLSQVAPMAAQRPEQRPMAAGPCNGGPGSGHSPTAAPTAPCPPGPRWRGSSGAANDGGGWSRAPASPASSAP